VGQTVPGTILKVNPFGLFVKLDEEIHGLAHISLLNVGAKDKISDFYKADEVRDFEIVSISPAEHRLGLKLVDEKTKDKKESVVSEKPVKKVKEKVEKDEKKDKKEKKVKIEKTDKE
jgi:predicted RNA-binding protein with RPS1 domain